MSLLLLFRKTATPPEPDKLRNRTGIRAIFDKAMKAGEKVTLDEATAILRENW